ncbi:hypothetical protein X801_04529 [Opisthorchis viverrini]|uniref:Uncharacterized protein n=1 Tax=Opisthorchis viverrini TaxID=6198 RepID=A0A1S8WYW5_OPIVI|nr:hypothetical protein X801_04529 [Opisthorchis viverrini]
MIAALLTLVVKHKYKLYKAVLSFNSIAFHKPLGTLLAYSLLLGKTKKQANVFVSKRTNYLRCC